MVGEFAVGVFSIFSASSIFFLILPGIFYLLPFAAFFLFMSQPQMSRVPEPQPANVIMMTPARPVDALRRFVESLDNMAVIPAKAGIQSIIAKEKNGLDSRFRGNDAIQQGIGDFCPTPPWYIFMNLLSFTAMPALIYSVVFARPPTRFESCQASRAPPVEELQ